MNNQKAEGEILAAIQIAKEENKKEGYFSPDIHKKSADIIYNFIISILQNHKYPQKDICDFIKMYFREVLASGAEILCEKINKIICLYSEYLPNGKYA